LTPPALEHALQLRAVQALLRQRHRPEIRAIERKALDRPDVARPLDHQAVAGIEKDLADEVQRLLRAGGDQHLVGRNLDPVPLPVARRDPLAQRRKTLGGRILERVWTALGQDVRRGLGHGLNRKGFRMR